MIKKTIIYIYIYICIFLKTFLQFIQPNFINNNNNKIILQISFFTLKKTLLKNQANKFHVLRKKIQVAEFHKIQLIKVKLTIILLTNLLNFLKIIHKYAKINNSNYKNNIII